MASIRQTGETYNVVFSYGSSPQWVRSCGKDRTRARLQKQQVELTVAQLRKGLLTIPPDCDDVGEFLWTGGRVTRSPGSGLPVTLGEAFDKYLESSHVKSLAENSQYTIEIHAGHLKRLLGENRSLAGLKSKDIQRYIDDRKAEKVVGGTARAEVTTLRTMWNKYALPEEIVARNWASAFPQKFTYGKMTEKPPFRTYQQITELIEQGGSEDLWKSLYLQPNETRELLAILEKRHNDPAFNSVHSWVYPAVAVSIYTSFRRSSLQRMRVSDVDITGNRLAERNKKIDHNKEETRREVHMFPALRPILERWLQDHPGGEFLFCNKANVKLTEKQMDGGLKLYLKDTEWDVIPGWHTFRHTFTSDAVKSGVPVEFRRMFTGHQSDETERRYIHLAPSSVAEQTAKMYQ